MSHTGSPPSDEDELECSTVNGEWSTVEVQSHCGLCVGYSSLLWSLVVLLIFRKLLLALVPSLSSHGHVGVT